MPPVILLLSVDSNNNMNLKASFQHLADDTGCNKACSASRVQFTPGLLAQLNQHQTTAQRKASLQTKNKSTKLQTYRILEQTNYPKEKKTTLINTKYK